MSAIPAFSTKATPRAAARVALAATFMKADTADGLRWMFQDVHPGGVAALAGIVPGDILLSIGGKDFVPPQAMPFALGERYDVVVRKRDDSTARLTLDVPRSKDKSRPLVVPRPGGDDASPRRAASATSASACFRACWGWTSRAT